MPPSSPPPATPPGPDGDRASTAAPAGPRAGEVTSLLAAAQAGDDPERLLELVYDELRGLASAQMARERPGLTLQPTALVHEAWLRLVGAGERTFEGRVHFFRAAARAMRRILLDRARRVAQPKHGGGLDRVSLNGLQAQDAAATPEALLDLTALSAALDELESFDPRMSELVALRWLAGLSVEETGTALGISTRTVKREWSVARAWLAERLDGGAE